MIRPSKDEGVGDCSANPLKTLDNQQTNFASDDDRSKAFVTTQARAAMAGGRRHSGQTVPDLRAIGDLLRQIGRER